MDTVVIDEEEIKDDTEIVSLQRRRRKIPIDPSKDVGGGYFESMTWLILTFEL